MVLAGATGVCGIVDTLIDRHNGLLSAHTGWALVVSLVASGMLVVRQRRVVWVFVFVLAAHLVAFTPMPLALAMYTAGTSTRSPRRLALYAITGTLVHALAVQGCLPLGARTLAYTLAFAVGPLIWGQATAIRRDLADAWEERAHCAARESELLIARAQSAERARIAREMHDTVAHHVGNMTVTATALALRMPAVRGEAGLIRDEGRAALAELRQILGILARRTDLAPPAPAGLAQIPALVGATRAAAGVPIGLAVTGTAHDVPDTVERAVYRAVQEALTNAVKHAPGAIITIRLTHHTHSVTADIHNGPATRPATALPSSGHGLIGLAERLQLLNATLTTRLTEDGGFHLHTRIPLPTTPPPNPPHTTNQTHPGKALPDGTLPGKALPGGVLPGGAGTRSVGAPPAGGAGPIEGDRP